MCWQVVGTGVSACGTRETVTQAHPDAELMWRAGGEAARLCEGVGVSLVWDKISL